MITQCLPSHTQPPISLRIFYFQCLPVYNSLCMYFLISGLFTLPDWAYALPDWAYVLPDWAFVLHGWAYVLPGWAFVLTDWAFVLTDCHWAHGLLTGPMYCMNGAYELSAWGTA